jgi:hypothetical protein
MASFTTRYTPPRTNMLQLSIYIERTAYANSMIARMNHGADRPMACSEIAPA